MNVIVTLGHRQFNITNRGYARLEENISRLTSQVAEAMRGVVEEDAENRLADYFASRMSAGNVLTDTDIDAAFADLGLGTAGKGAEGEDETEDRADSATDSDFESTKAGSDSNNSGPTQPNGGSSNGKGQNGGQSNATSANQRKGLWRSTQHSVLGGVCGGLADKMDIDVVWVRLGIVLAVLITMQPLVPVIYLIMWVLLPKDNDVANSDGSGGEVNLGGSGGSSSGCLRLVLILLLCLLAFIAFWVGIAFLPFFMLGLCS